jgi:hypothetical protein
LYWNQPANVSNKTPTSPSSLKLNAKVRKKVFGSLSNLVSASGCLQDGSPRTKEDQVYTSDDDFDVGLVLPFKQGIFERACATELPDITIAEHLALAGDVQSMSTEWQETDEDSFSADPLILPDGVAVTEESLEFGEADILTQA